MIASDVARTRTNGCIFFKLRDPNVDVLPSHYYSHKFVCVAPYSTDTLLLINIPKTMLEKVIKVRFIFELKLKTMVGRGQPSMRAADFAEMRCGQTKVAGCRRRFLR